MSKLREPYRCDHCGKLRESDANHWWILFDAWFPPNGKNPLKAEFVNHHGLMIVAWHEALADLLVRHACGMECALKLAERFMTTRSFEPPSARPISAPTLSTVEGSARPVSSPQSGNPPISQSDNPSSSTGQEKKHA